MTYQNARLNNQTKPKSISPKREYGSNNETWNAQLDSTDAVKARRFMNHELIYYNGMLEIFNSYVKCQPDSLLLLVDEWETIFGIIAQESFQIATLRNARLDAPLPTALEPHRKLLCGRDDTGRRHLTEKMLILLEIAGKPGHVHPQVRRNMALEMLSYYREQATAAQQTVKSSVMGETEITYKNSLTALEKMDDTRKRHLQIPRSIVRFTWDEDQKAMLLYTPYNSKPIVIPGLHYMKEKQWNLLILHQEGGKVANLSTPWKVELRTVPTGYVLRYMELSNPYLSGSKFRFAKQTR